MATLAEGERVPPCVVGLVSVEVVDGEDAPLCFDGIAFGAQHACVLSRLQAFEDHDAMANQANG